jgi:hypothetical protein
MRTMSNRPKALKLAKMLWGWVPHSSQREWLLADAKVKVAACGRRWGKTEAAAIDVATAAILKPGCRQMIVSPSYDQSRIIIDTVERLFSSHRHLNKMYSIARTPYTRMNIGKSLISARTADEDGRNLRGHWADRVIVDEAAYVRDSVINEVIAPMLADKNGELVLISTPFGRNHFYRSFVRGENGGDGRCISMSFPSVSNPHISSEYIESQREYITDRQYAVEYEARFIEDANAVFPIIDIQRAMGQVKPTGGGWVVMGLDWARYADYTAMIAMDECQVIAVDRLNGLPWQVQIDRVVQFIRDHNVNAVLADQTSIGDPLNEQLRDRLCEVDLNVRVEGLVFTLQSKRELIDGLAVGFARGLPIIPEHRDLLSELSFFEYEISEHGNVKMGARHGCHDDLVIAMALAWKLSQSTSPISIRTIGHRLSYSEY